MLVAARRQYDQQQRLVAMAIRQARRRHRRGDVVRTVALYQAASIALAAESAEPVLKEQGIDPTTVAAMNGAALLTPGSTVAGFVGEAATDAAFDRLVATLTQDAGRTATAVDATTRPAVTRYIRSLSTPSCARCAILAGRVYRWSTGFKRHPLCDCLMTQSNEAGADLVTDPQKAFESGQIKGLSKGDTEAVSMGADLNQVVNVRRKKAGLTYGSSVIKRGNRLTPQGCLTLGRDRAEALALLKFHRYIT